MRKKFFGFCVVIGLLCGYCFTGGAPKEVKSASGLNPPVGELNSTVDGASIGSDLNSLAQSKRDFDEQDERKKAIDVAKDTKVMGVSGGARKLVDRIVARVNGRNILLSDLKEPRIDKGGEPYSISEMIDNELLFQKAAQRKLLAKAMDIEKQIAAWKEAHHLMHLTEKEFEQRLRNDGLTGERYRNQLGRVLAVRNLRSIEISERVVVSAREVEEYHKANPEFSDERYLMRTKIVPYSLASTVEEAKEKMKKINWIDVDWIDRSKLASVMEFVVSMKEGQISDPIKVEQGFQFVKLVKKEASRQETLDERWVSIERDIQEKKMKIFEDDYTKELRKDASIVYL